MSTTYQPIRASDPLLGEMAVGNESAELWRRAQRYPAGSTEREAFQYAADRMFTWIDEKVLAELAGRQDRRQGWDR
jgi:hypothetical protein